MTVETPEDASVDQQIFERARCIHCGGVHLRACPRVKSMTFAPSGSLVAVRFWKEFDDSNITWPEQVYTSDDQTAYPGTTSDDGDRPQSGVAMEIYRQP